MQRSQKKNRPPFSEDSPGARKIHMGYGAEITGEEEAAPDILCEIVDIAWERVFLQITVRKETKDPLFLRLPRKRKKEQRISLSGEELSPNLFFYRLNMTTIGGRSFLENGRWKVGLCPSEGEFTPCTVAEDLARKIDGLDRIFRYGNSFAYTVNFEAYTSDDVSIHLNIHSKFMQDNSRWKRRGIRQETSKSPKPFRKFRFLLIRLCINRFYRIAIRFLPRRGNRILLMSETKEDAGGNIKAISERLFARGLDRKFLITHSLRRAVGDKKSAFSWLKTTMEIAKNDIIIIDDYAPIFGFLNLDKRTRLIQVWHAGVGFKAVGYCRFGRSGSPYPIESCHRKYDLALCGSPGLVHVYEEVFGIEPEAIKPLGLPRMDGTLEEGRSQAFREKFYGKYPALRGKKVILFAPTFRGVGQKDAYYNYSKIDFPRLWDFCGEDTVVLMKMHPFISYRPELEPYNPRILEFSDYPNINELYDIADILITDYSSAYYEFAAMRRPILFFTYDRVLYEVTRGVHQSILESAPGRVCDSFEELMEALEREEYHFEKTEQFAAAHFGSFNRNATDAFIDRVLLQAEE
jgi:CDP-ribitol ribitolphosphotransferase